MPLPDSQLKETRESVNETYTRISEVYEPHRRSHTGNVFQKVLYLRKTVGIREIWSPLEVLRLELEATLEQRFRAKQNRQTA
jgi:hypothetical protein